MDKKPHIAFWGTPEIAACAFSVLASRGFTPDLVICAPDKPRGRGLQVSAPKTKVWAQLHNIPVMQPTDLHDPEFISALRATPWDVFIVFAYGKIIPQEILVIPTHGVLNIHPSLLPKLRGPSPIQTALLQETETGVTIMQMDDKMDHGPIVAQRKIPITPWPIKTADLEKILSEEGAALLAGILPEWIGGTRSTTEQDHAHATYSKKFTKEDGLLNLNDSPLINLRKIKAFSTTPRAHFFKEHNSRNVRVIVTDAHILPDGNLEILRVIPEGGKEIDYKTFLAQG